MRVMFISSEIFPFAKSGGLADVVYSLSRAVGGYDDVQSAEAVMPLYSFIDRERFSIKAAHIEFNVCISGETFHFEVYTALKDGVRYWFLYTPILCDRDFMYGTPSGAYPDNDLRFGLFCYGVMEWLLKFHKGVDVLHLNDWQTALIALLAREHYHSSHVIVFTIHNLAYQGIFSKDTMYRLGLDWRYFTLDKIEFYDQVNFLKAGVAYADAVTVVSPSYAKEIMTPEFGCGLDGFLRVYGHKIRGIMNGIDYDVFSPERDRFVAFNYSSRDVISGKRKNKTELMRMFGIDSKDKPLLIFIGRFTYQKGVNLLLSAVEYIAGMNVNLFVLGSGEQYYSDSFAALEYPNVIVKVGYDESLAHMLYASGDILLMPSMFEPCGLNQLIAARYGVLPVVRGVGGLKDSVVDFKDSESRRRAVGVVFDKPDVRELCTAICRALSVFADKGLHRKLITYNMSLDFSWRLSAGEYIKLYRELIKGERNGRQGRED